MKLYTPMKNTFRTFTKCHQAIAGFPTERALKFFRALTLFNLNRTEESVGDLLIQLLDTTADASIKSYDGALRFKTKVDVGCWPFLQRFSRDLICTCHAVGGFLKLTR